MDSEIRLVNRAAQVSEMTRCIHNYESAETEANTLTPINISPGIRVDYEL
jgi:hypothetical protein